jgi:hypothetical protein
MFVLVGVLVAVGGTGVLVGGTGVLDGGGFVEVNVEATMTADVAVGCTTTEVAVAAPAVTTGVKLGGILVKIAVRVAFGVGNVKGVGAATPG